MSTSDEGYKKLANAIQNGVVELSDPAQLELDPSVFKVGPKIVNNVPSVDAVAIVTGVSANATVNV